MSFVTIVRVELRGSERAISGARVSLYDRDTASADDLLGTAFTDLDGEARFVYSGRDLRNEASLRDESSVKSALAPQAPDLYVVVYGEGDRKVASTRTYAREDTMPPLVVVEVDLQAARDAGLIRRKPPTEAAVRRARWERRRREEAKRKKGPGTDDCLARVLLDLVSGVAAPRNDLQKRLALALPDKVSAEERVLIAEKGREARDLIDQSFAPGSLHCSSDTDPAELAAHFLRPGGSMHGITTALRSAAPDPRETLPGVQVPGIPFKTEVLLNKECVARFGGDQPPPLDDASAAAMREAIRGKQLVAPSVNLIEIWDPVACNVLRAGHPSDRTMLVRALSGKESWVDKTIEMQVPVAGPDSLVQWGDQNGMQQLIMDVVPGMVLDLQGSGFINVTASVEAYYRPWQDTTNEERLTPFAGPEEVVAGLHGSLLPAYGSTVPHGNWTSESYRFDRIVFEWPATASAEGLYRLRFTFRNDQSVTETPTLVTQQDDCSVDLDYSPVSTADLWFAVLPPVVFPRTTAHLTSVTCENESDPEHLYLPGLPALPGRLFNLYDSILGEARSAIQFVDLDFHRQHPELTIRSGQLFDHTMDVGLGLGGSHRRFVHEFWSAPELFSPNLGLTEQEVGPFSMVLFTATLLEEDETLSGAISQLVLDVLVLALTLLINEVLFALLVAATLIMVAGQASPPLGFLLNLLGMLITVIATPALTSWMALRTALLAMGVTTPLADIVGDVTAVFGGPEIAHRCSALRFRRALWVHDRAPAVSALSMTRETQQFDALGIRESFTCASTDLGSVYKIDMQLSLR